MRIISLICLLALTLSQTVSATLTEDIDSPPAITGAAAQNIGLLYPGIYKMGHDTPFFPRATITNGVTSADNDELFTIYKDQPFAVRFENGNALITALVPLEAKGSVPDTYIVPRKDFPIADLSFLMDGDATVLAANFTTFATEAVACGGHCKALVERHFGFHAGGKCASTLTSGVLATVHFYPTSCGSAMLQVWSGHGCGHVAWRAGNSWSSGDCQGDPGSGFHSMGCYSR